MSYVGAGSVSGCFCGHLYLHNLSSYTCCNSYVRHVGGRGRNPWPNLLFLWPDVTFGISWLNWQLLCTTKWPRMIPLLVSKPSPDSWLVNSTSKPVAKQDVCCQSGSSHVETPGKVIQLEEARRSEKEEERGGWGVQQAFYMQLFCIRNDYLQGK